MATPEERRRVLELAKKSKKWPNLTQLLDTYNCPQRLVRSAISEGHIVSYKLGSCVKVDPDSFADWLIEQQEATPMVLDANASGCRYRPAELMTVQEAAEYLNVMPSTILTYANDSVLEKAPGYPRRDTRVYRSSVVAYKKGRKRNNG
jgi:hypothetical protein